MSRGLVERDDVVEALGLERTENLERVAVMARRWSFVDDEMILWTAVAGKKEEFRYFKSR